MGNGAKSRDYKGDREGIPYIHYMGDALSVPFIVSWRSKMEREKIKAWEGER